MPDCSKPLELPFPPRILHPNARPHYMALSRAKKSYKSDVYFLAKDAIRRKQITLPDSEKIALRLTFVPPMTPGPVGDDDGMEAAFKSGRDGLALALNIDDKRFQASKTVLPRDPAFKHGCVFVQLTAVP